MNFYKKNSILSFGTVIVIFIKFFIDSMCGITWDTIICWPETPVNFSVNVPCPIYVNKFNRKSKLFFNNYRLQRKILNFELFLPLNIFIFFKDQNFTLIEQILML
jgi:hypothetical protein